jgi:twinkle protein
MLSENHVKGIVARSLCPEVAAHMGLYSGKRLRDGSIEPDVNGKILCFPYMEREKEVNTKYRWSEDGQRRFMQRKDAVKTLFNANCLLDEEMLKVLENGDAELVWTEGEFDTIAAVECGFAHTVSVPDGALPARDKNGKLIHVPDDADDLDPEDDDKFSFMGLLMPQLQRVKTHVIAVDDDEPGRRLAKELVRRLGPARCRWIKYPTEEVVPDKKNDGRFRTCKDLNEVKMYFGADKVREIIENSLEWPVSGLYKLSQYPEVEIPEMVELGLSKEFDEHVKFYAGMFVVCTGVPNMGKSTLINQASVILAKKHKWPIAIFSGEKGVKPFLAQELMTGFLEKEKKEWTAEDKARATAFVERYYQFIDYDDERDDIEMDVEFIIKRAETAVFREGTKALIIDPWNELEHRFPKHMTMTQYVGDAIRQLKRFAKRTGCAVFVVAHPTKVPGGEVPSLYNISDSAHWANKPDLGLVVHGDDPTLTERDIHIKKVRLKRIAGNVGMVKLQFDERTNLFVPPEF